MWQGKTRGRVDTSSYHNELMSKSEPQAQSQKHIRVYIYQSSNPLIKKQFPKPHPWSLKTSNNSHVLQNQQQWMILSKIIARWKRQYVFIPANGQEKRHNSRKSTHQTDSPFILKNKIKNYLTIFPIPSWYQCPVHGLACWVIMPVSSTRFWSLEWLAYSRAGRRCLMKNSIWERTYFLWTGIINI